MHKRSKNTTLRRMIQQVGSVLQLQTVEQSTLSY